MQNPLRELTLCFFQRRGQSWASHSLPFGQGTVARSMASKTCESGITADGSNVSLHQTGKRDDGTTQYAREERLQHRFHGIVAQHTAGLIQATRAIEGVLREGKQTTPSVERLVSAIALVQAVQVIQSQSQNTVILSDHWSLRTNPAPTFEV